MQRLMMSVLGCSSRLPQPWMLTTRHCNRAMLYIADTGWWNSARGWPAFLARSEPGGDGGHCSVILLVVSKSNWHEHGALSLQHAMICAQS